MHSSCAKCRMPTLQPATLADDVPALVCHRCGGMWLEKEEVLRLAERGREVPGSSTWDALRQAMDRLAGWCPHGHGVMFRTRLELDEVFHLERCNQCEGTWFDAGEWNHLVRRNLLRKLQEFWTPGWEKRLRGANARKAHLRRVEQRVGRDLFHEIMSLAGLLRRHSAGREALAFLVEEVQLKQDERTFDGLVTGTGENATR
ncbi:MAG: zf-TFIIB domain-containing protein [Myxococcota bacterium]